MGQTQYFEVLRYPATYQIPCQYRQYLKFYHNTDIIIFESCKTIFIQ